MRTYSTYLPTYLYAYLPTCLPSCCVGYVDQRDIHFPTLTVRETLRFALYSLGVTSRTTASAERKRNILSTRSGVVLKCKVWALCALVSIVLNLSHFIVRTYEPDGASIAADLSHVSYI